MANGAIFNEIRKKKLNIRGQSKERLNERREYRYYNSFTTDSKHLAAAGLKLNITKINAHILLFIVN